MTSRRFSIRFDSDVADRVDVLARYVGRDRSGFIRLAVALADCSLTLRDLRETEGATADDPRVIRVTQDMAVIVNALRPVAAPRLSDPIPAVLLSPNYLLRNNSAVKPGNETAAPVIRRGRS